MNINRLLPHRNLVVIEALQGAGPDGDMFAAAKTLDRAYIEDGVHLVRDRTGAQVTSSTTVYVRLADWAPAGSRVTVWAGMPAERTSTVITAQRLTHSAATPNHAVLHLE